MDLLSLIVKYFDTNIIYQDGNHISQFILTYITPFLIVIAIAVRNLESSLSMIKGRGAGVYGHAIFDIVIWLVLLVSYYVAANLLTSIFNAIYNSFYHMGSLDNLMGVTKQFFDKLDASAKASGNKSIFDFINPITLISVGIYYLSVIWLSLVLLFMKIGHAIGYSLAVAWGLIVIPMAITTSFKTIKPWAIFLSTLLVWPVVHFILMSFISPIISHAATSLLSVHGLQAFSSMRRASLYSLFAIMNIVVSACIIAAPYVTYNLIQNGSISGLVTPFLGSAAMATGIVFENSKLGQKTLSTLGKNAGTAAGSVLSHSGGLLDNGINRVRSAIMGPQANQTTTPPQGGGGGTSPSPGGGGSGPSSSPGSPGSELGSSSANSSPSTPMTNPGASSTTDHAAAANAKAAQARRGAIIHQAKTKPGGPTRSTP